MTKLEFDTVYLPQFFNERDEDDYTFITEDITKLCIAHMNYVMPKDPIHCDHDKFIYQWNGYTVYLSIFIYSNDFLISFHKNPVQ